jgi:hypothetical protein
MENFKAGDHVVYVGCSAEQVRWGNNNDPRGILMENQKYYVKKVEVHSQHTKLTLCGVSGRFNSVCFKKV